MDAIDNENKRNNYTTSKTDQNDQHEMSWEDLRSFEDENMIVFEFERTALGSCKHNKAYKESEYILNWVRDSCLVCI